MNDILGPAADIPEYYAALMLLQVRGCTVTWRPPAPNVLEVYEVRYRRDEDDTTPRARVRLFYTDGYRGTQQALNLLRELSFGSFDALSNDVNVLKMGLEV